MQMIAFRRIFYWFWDEACDLFEDRVSLFYAGMIAIFINFLLKVSGQVGQWGGTSQFVLSIVVGRFLAEAVLNAILIGNAKARVHERTPGLADLMPDPMLVLHLGVAKFVCAILTNLPLIMVAGGAVAVFLSGGLGSALGALQLTLGMGLAFLLSVFLWPLAMFVPYLIIDRRLHFWDAIRFSFECVIRDYPGLVVFNLIWVMCQGMIAIISAMCPFGLALYVLTPALYTTTMRAYADYFGLGRDWVLEAQLRRQGYHQMASAVASHEDSPYYQPPAPPGGKQ